VVEKDRDRLAVGTKAAEALDVEKLNLKKLNELEVRKEYHIKISNRFAALGNLSEKEDISRA
jgi:hypothetical protein